MSSVGRPGTAGLSAHTTGCPSPSMRFTTGHPRRVISLRSHSAARRQSAACAGRVLTLGMARNSVSSCSRRGCSRSTKALSMAVSALGCKEGSSGKLRRGPRSRESNVTYLTAGGGPRLIASSGAPRLRCFPTSLARRKDATQICSRQNLWTRCRIGGCNRRDGDGAGYLRGEESAGVQRDGAGHDHGAAQRHDCGQPDRQHQDRQHQVGFDGEARQAHRQHQGRRQHAEEARGADRSPPGRLGGQARSNARPDRPSDAPATTPWRGRLSCGDSAESTTARSSRA